MKSNATSKEKQKQAFIETAHKSGCDPDDPRVLEALQKLRKRPLYGQFRLRPLGASPSPPRRSPNRRQRPRKAPARKQHNVS
jgi:hypothetical protein